MIKKLIATAITPIFLISCATKEGYEGAVAGGTAGAVVGSTIDKQNPWRGAFIGGILGAVIVGTITDVSAQAAKESVKYGEPVVYVCKKHCRNRVKIVAIPVGRGKGRCKIVKLKYFENGRLIKIEKRKVCIRKHPGRCKGF